MPWAPRDQAQMGKTNQIWKVVANIFHLAIWVILGNAKRIQMKTVCLKGWQWIFSTKMQSSCIHERIVQVNAGLAPPPAQPAGNQGHGSVWVVGIRTPRLFQQVCDLLQGTAHSPASVPHPVPLWHSLGCWLLLGVFPDTWQFQPVRMARVHQGCIWGCTKEVRA